MKKTQHDLFTGLLILMGLVFFLGKEHFLLGSLLGMLQYALIVLGALILFVRRKKGFEAIHIILAGMVAVLFCYALYQ